MHPIVQLEAAKQLTSPSQLSCPLHFTTHGNPAGQTTPEAQALLPLQLNVQAPTSQVPPRVVQFTPHATAGGESGKTSSGALSIGASGSTGPSSGNPPAGGL